MRIGDLVSVESLDTAGIIAVQIHGGAKSIVRYKDLRIRELNSTVAPKK